MKTLLFITAQFLCAQVTYAQQQRLDKIDSLQIVLKSSRDDTNKVKIFHALNITWMGVDLDSAVEYGIKTAYLSQELGWEKGMWAGYHQVGLCFQNKGAYIEALKNMDKALKVCDRKTTPDELNTYTATDKLKWKSKTLGNIGLVYFYTGNYVNALNYQLQALKLVKDDEKEIISGCINLGNIYNAQLNYDKAIEYYNKATKLSEKYNNIRTMTLSLLNMAVVYHKKKEFTKSLEYNFRALELAEQTEDKIYESNILNNLGEVYYNLKQINEAIRYSKRALALAEELKSNDNIAAFLGSLGSYYLEKKEYSEAETHLLRALKISKESNTTSYTMQIESSLSKLYMAMEQYKKALEYANYATILKDSLNTVEKANEINNKMVGYEFDKQKNEQDKKDLITQATISREKLLRNSTLAIAGIIILMSIISFVIYKRKRDADQRSKETAAALRISETNLKALRLQMNPHFINNAMQSVQYFLNRHQPEEAEKYLVKFSNLMGKVLSHSDREEISLAEELEVLEWYMQLECLRMTHPFNFSFNIDSSIDPENTFIPPNILQPFVENSIKHGLSTKPSSGTIKITVNRKNNLLHIKIEDDGVGRSAPNMHVDSKLRKESHGIKITRERLDVLNKKNRNESSLNIIDLYQDNQPSGTLIELNLPFEL